MARIKKVHGEAFKAKVALAQWALQHPVGFITVGAAGGKRLAHKVDIDDLFEILANWT